MKQSLPHILVIDDDKRLRGLIRDYLTENGMLATTAIDAINAAEILKYLEFDILVLDVNMPRKTGWEFLTELRQTSDIPVLMLTALGETGHRIKGLETGADDYLVKPFEPKELLLRIRSILKRGQKTPEIIHFGRFSFDIDSAILRTGDEVIALTSKESEVLKILAQNADKPVSRNGLGESERAVDVQITRLRKKIEDDAKKPVYIQTIRNEGYRLNTK